jgi:hypothetical protein
MSVAHVKPKSWIWLLVGLFIGLFIGLGIDKVSMNEVSVDTNPTFIPGRVVNITLDHSQQEKLFAQLDKFAEKWRYAIRIEVTDLSWIYSVDMWRSDIHIAGVYSHHGIAGEIQLAFMDTDSTRPTPAQYFEEEVQDLKTFMDEIPNSTFMFWTPPAPPQK